MVAVASSKENLNSKCVKHEWKGFHNDIVKGIKRNGQIFTFVENIRKSEMSRQLRNRISFDISERAVL